MHIYRWDLDKTYLDTNFSSLRGLVRAATEPAEDKRAVPGATALIRGLAGGSSARIYILSGSPTQMRAVLEEKLRLDGVRYDGLVLKDNLSNLRKGRFRAIRGQFGYKLPVLLAAREGIGKGVHESLFGDDAEVDALIYSVYADTLAGHLTSAQVSRIMEAAGAYPDRIEVALEAIAQLPTGEVVDNIYIHLDRSSPPSRFAALGPRVVPVFSWWQAALVLYGKGRLTAAGVRAVTEEVVETEGLDDWAFSSLAQDIVRRGHLASGTLDSLVDESDTLAHCARSAGRITPPPPCRQPHEIDYLSILQRWS